MKMPKDLRHLARAVHEAGYCLSPGGNHYAIRNSEGKRVGTFPVTQSDGRQMKNMRAQLRRAGILP